MVNKKRKIIEEVAEQLKNEKPHPSEMTQKQRDNLRKKLKEKIAIREKRLNETPDSELTSKELTIKEIQQRMNAREKKLKKLQEKNEYRGGEKDGK